MKIEGHLTRLDESLRKLEEVIQGDLTKNQMTIGFHTSEAAVNLLELYLHKKNLADFTYRFQHNWMNSKKKLIEKLYFDFPNKERIINLLYSIERNRDKLCYGKPQPEEAITEQLERFNELKKIFEEMGMDEKS